MTEGNRDPKVYWHEESKGYIMSLYLKNHVYAILRSEDLEHWELTQKLPFITARECPDLQPGSYRRGRGKVDPVYGIGRIFHRRFRWLSFHESFGRTHGLPE